MNIALLTIWREKNYGAELQAYATVKLLQRLGHHVKMIDIRLSDSRKENFNKKIYNLVCGLTPGHRKFEKFWKKNIPVTKRYRSIEELQKNPPEADIYMIGSDQVWNPDLTGKFSLLYFLNFGSESIKRVSFASSFGSPIWKYPELKDDVQQLLNRFCHVTCREKSGILLLKNEFNMIACNVVDPTLILYDYSDFLTGVAESQTLVYYPLYADSELEIFSKKLSDELGLKFINNGARRYVLGRVEWDRIGVEEWVRNIAGARFVITRSFHGLLFSLMFHRSFAIIASKDGRNSRITDFLSLIGLSNRIFDCVEDLYCSKIWNDEIDYVEIDKKLSELRVSSLNELKRELDI